MKKLLFCYDGPIKKDDKNEYYGTSLTDNVFKRYEVIAKEISIAIRVRNIKENENTMRYTKIKKEKYNIIECPNVSSLKGIIFDNRKCRKILEREIKNVDYVIARLPSMIGNLAVDIAEKMKKPYLIEMVGCPWDAFWNHSLKGKFFAPIMTMMTKRLVKNSHYVLYVSNEFLQKRYPTNGKSIGCSDVVLKKLDKNILEDRMQRVSKITKDSKIILATLAAVNVKYKGQQYVFKVIKNMKKLGYNIEYRLIGGGNNQYLKKLAKKYNIEKEVNFVGTVKHNEVFEILKQIDIYIQPSLQEGMCRALIEAMSTACCCAASNAGGNSELLDNEVIFKKKNIKELQKILEKLINNNTIIEKQCKRNYEYSKNYDESKIEKRRNDFYLIMKREAENENNISN